MLRGFRTFDILSIGSAAMAIIGFGSSGAAAQQKIVSDGTVTVYVADTKSENKVDFVKAAPLKLPIAKDYSTEQADRAIKEALTSTRDGLPPVEHSSEGAVGSGQQNTLALGEPAPLPHPNLGMAFGTANLPFSTARADLDQDPTNARFPYRAAGKLFFNEGGQSYICSASLIERGIVVTAAHCVAEFGKKRYHSDWQFAPGYRNGVAPFNVWTVAQAAVLTSYYDGSDSCQQAGVVCQNDVAILVLNPQKKDNGGTVYAGDLAGWFSYGWDRAGFTPQSITHVTQIGYPACLDDAAFMERNDSQGTIDGSFSNNTVIGSLMCGGSSGGPWLINFGVQPKLKQGDFGFASKPNEVIGVTSWGSTDGSVKWMGASPFLATNIVPMVASACKAMPEACKGEPPNP